MLKNFILLLPCLVCLHSAVTLFISRKKNFRSQNIWMICMLLMFVCFYIWAIYYGGVEDFKIHYKLNVIDTTLALAFFPFIFLYIRSLTDETPLGWKDFLWFLPSLLIGSSSLILYIYMGEERATSYIQQIIWDYRSIKNFDIPVYKVQYFITIICYYTVFMVQIIFGMKYTITSLISYQKRLEDFYSNPEIKSLGNMKAMLTGAFTLLVFFLLGIVEAYLFLHRHPILVYILMSGYAVILYYLNYLVINIKYTAESFAESLRQSDKEAEEHGYATIEDIINEQKPSSIIKKSKREELIFQLNTLLNDNKIFLQKDLRMDDIVRLTQVNRTYISLLITEEYQCSFSELINSKRIDYAQRLALAKPHLLHAQIAVESGFSHASSFCRTFKQYTGMTFKEWYNKHSIK